MRIPMALFVLFAALAANDAEACSCIKGSQSDAFRGASAVFIARLAAIDQTRIWRAQGAGKHEVATLEVLEAWKGKWLPGDSVRVEGDVFNASGMCDASIVNDPPWSVDPQGKPLKFSGLWLMYVSGDEPFQHSLCSWSKPLELGIGELAWLYQRATPLPTRKR